MPEPGRQRRIVIDLRPQTPADQADVRRVVEDAFGRSEFGHNGEADIVEQIRDNCRDAVSLVAIIEKKVVGHILFSPVTLSTSGLVGMGLGPMAAIPERQRSGIGGALIEEGMRRLATRSCPFVVVLGHPDYYPRFGFRPAREIGVTHGFAGIPQDMFFIKALDPEVMTSGEVALYRPEFGPQRAEA